MTFKEIEQKRQDLLNILKIEPEGKQNQPLRDLAKEVGAQQPNAKNVEFRDMIVSNINHALQTASAIEACRTAARNYKIALVAAGAAALSAFAAWIAVLAR